MTSLPLLIKLKTYIWQSIRPLGNLTFAISLLLSIACCSIIGTIIEQNHNLKFYIDTYSGQNKILKIGNWKIIKILQLDHVYTSWWFVGLILILSSSLIVCSLSRQLPMLKRARKWKFYLDNYKILKFTNTTSLTNTSSSILAFILNQRNYHVFQQNNKIYAYNGLAGKIAPIFVHLSIVLLLTGSLLGFFGGVLIQETIPIGETVHPQNIITAGKISYLKQKFSIYIDKFSIQYNLDGSIRQFISNIFVLNPNGKQVSTKILAVNNPMYFQDITIYQTDWDIVAIRLRLENNTIVQVPCQLLDKKNNKIWICVLKVSNKNTLFITIPDLTGVLYIYNNQGNLINVVSLHHVIQASNIEIRFEDIITRTGLQIKVDPGTRIVYLSFSILIVSVISSYISYSQLWMVYSGKKSYLGGKTNRAFLDFEEDLRKIETHNIYAHKTILKTTKSSLVV
uniref:Cytochrome c biogenesis protein CcsB n=1 Tax=Hildenbrandia rubra TaxID=31481 RepID=A0A1C9CG76_9FLOR|nr:c-type cytochrome biogenensis protein [Hildenbrandia rubra]AOM67398.1 c-type cytochrome biogenensis protein [Hildenbrandia rubra]